MKPQVVTDNPNASAGGLTLAIITLVVWGASAAGVEIPPEVALAAGTVITTLVLYFGPKKPA